MPNARDRHRPFWVLRVEAGAPPEPLAVDARDVPAAWRRAERESGESAFALYGPDKSLIRVGVPPPAPWPQVNGATAVALSPDAERLIVGQGGHVRVFDRARGLVLWDRTLGSSAIDAFLLPRRATWFVACMRSGDVWVLDRDRGDPILHVIDEDARSVALSPDDRVLAVAGLVVNLWALPSGTRLAPLDLDVAAAMQSARAMDDAIDDDEISSEGIYALGFAGDGEHVVGVRSRHGGEIVSWNIRSGDRVAARSGVPVQRIIPISDGGTTLVRVHDDAGAVRAFELPSLRCVQTLTTGAEGLWDLRLTPDERFVLAHDEETGLYMVDRTTGEPYAWLDEFEACAYVVRSARGNAKRRRERFEESDDTHVVALPRWGKNDPGAPISSDGRRYAALRRRHDESLVAVFDLSRRAPYAALSHPCAAVSVWLDHNGRHSVTRDAEGRVYVWTLPEVPASLP